MRALEAALLNRLDHALENIGQAMARRGPEQVQAEGRADADHHFLLVRPLPGRALDAILNALGLILLMQRFLAQHFFLVQHVADGIELKAALFGNAVAGAGPEIGRWDHSRR